MCPVSAGCPQRTWTWGPHGQGAILLVNCDRDNPKSSTVDCKDDQLDSQGKDPPRTNGNRALPFCEAFVLSLVTTLGNQGYWKHVLFSMTVM